MKINKLLKEVLGNKFFTVKYVKKDGTRRVACARLGVTKGVKGTGSKRPDNIVTYYDVNKKGFRSFDWNRVERITQGNFTIFGEGLKII